LFSRVVVDADKVRPDLANGLARSWRFALQGRSTFGQVISHLVADAGRRQRPIEVLTHGLLTGTHLENDFAQNSGLDRTVRLDDVLDWKPLRNGCAKGTMFEHRGDVLDCVS
jgi:hypothetical protein